MATVLSTRLAIAPFLQWTYEDAVREFAVLKSSAYETRKRYAVDRDHYNQGKEWVGPGTAASTGKIEQQFAPEDAIGEVLSNVRNAFSEPQIGAVPIDEPAEGTQVPEQIKRRMQEAKHLLTWWWDRRNMQEHVQERQHTAAWAGLAGLRLWIPWRFLQKVGTDVTIRPTKDLREAIDYIHVVAPMPDVARIVEDAATKDLCALYFDEETRYGANGEKTTYKRVEMTFLDPEREQDSNADTIIRIVYANKELPALQARMKLGGKLTFSEMRVQSLLTDPVLRTQRQLNLLTTLITRIAETAAFRERYTKNAKPQGYRIPYEDGDTLPTGAFLERDEEGRLWAVLPQERTLGANTTTELVGLPQYDEKGDQKGNQMPDVLIVDPVDPAPYINAGDGTRRRILRMCAQGHLGGISNAEASGIAYEQARAVFEKDLNSRRVPEEGMLRELLSAVLAMAERITGQPGYFTEVIRVTVDQRIDPGPRSPDLVRLDLESYQGGLLGEETAMARIGVEDVTAEQSRVKRSALHILTLLEKAATVGATYDPESLLEVLKQLNLPQEVLNVIKVKEEPEPVAPVGAVVPPTQ